MDAHLLTTLFRFYVGKYMKRFFLPIGQYFKENP